MITAEKFVMSEIGRLDRERVDIDLAIKNKENWAGLEELQGNLFKINIIINYLGSFIGSEMLKKDTEL